MNDDFYIGYLAQSPPRLARHTRLVVVVLALVVTATAVLVAARQRPAEAGTFEFGVKRTFEGVLYEEPLPLLRVPHQGGAATNYLLVGFGKHGLPKFARGHHGQCVRLAGSLIQKGPAVMVELNDEASFTPLGPAMDSDAFPAGEAVGEVVLTGELVDTKCYFGVMRPATGKVHRACAVRCLSGGVPPGLLLRDADGNATVVLLAGLDEAGVKLDPQWAARIIQVEGLLLVRDRMAVVQTRRLRLVDEPSPDENGQADWLGLVPSR